MERQARSGQSTEQQQAGTHEHVHELRPQQLPELRVGDGPAAEVAAERRRAFAPEQGCKDSMDAAAAMQMRRDGSLLRHKRKCAATAARSPSSKVSKCVVCVGGGSKRKRGEVDEQDERGQGNGKMLRESARGRHAGQREARARHARILRGAAGPSMSVCS